MTYVTVNIDNREFSINVNSIGYLMQHTNTQQYFVGLKTYYSDFPQTDIDEKSFHKLRAALEQNR